MRFDADGVGAEGRVIDLSDLQDRLDLKGPQHIAERRDGLFHLAMSGVAAGAGLSPTTKRCHTIGSCLIGML